MTLSPASQPISPLQPLHVASFEPPSDGHCSYIRLEYGSNTAGAASLRFTPRPSLGGECAVLARGLHCTYCVVTAVTPPFVLDTRIPSLWT